MSRMSVDDSRGKGERLVKPGGSSLKRRVQSGGSHAPPSPPTPPSLGCKTEPAFPSEEAETQRGLVRARR